MDPKLYEAAMNGDLVYLQTLQETSSNLHSHRTPSRDTILHIATEFHQTEFARAAVRDCPPLLWQANISGDTALHIAAAENNWDMVQFFIDRTRSDVEVEESRHLRERMRMVNLEKDTALHCAVRSGSYECLELLLQTDPDVCGFVNNANESPLCLSIASGHWDMAEIFINFAPSSTLHKGPNGLTALHLALYFFNYPLEKIELLVKWRSEMIREGDNLGLTPFHYAALYERIEAIKLFIQYDSSAIYLLNEDGESALHIAAFQGHINVLEELINSRPDCYNMIDNKGRTILHAAVLGDRQEIVKYILETPRFGRLMMNKQDKDGNTALHLAASFKLHGVIEILAKNEKVSLRIDNKELTTPFDVFNKYKEEGIKAAVTASNLKSVKSTMTMQRFANAQLKKMNKEPSTTTIIATEETTTTSSNRVLNKEADEHNSNVGFQSALEVNLLVATLVATVTFAAGFTMPGGLINSGEEQGLVILTNKAAFKAFVIFNTFAFCCSVFAVLLQFHSSLAHHTRVRYMGLALISTTVAIVAMVLAFCCATFVVLTKSIRLSVSPFIICGFFAIVYFLIPLADPGVEGFPFLNPLQALVRRIIIRYVRCV